MTQSLELATRENEDVLLDCLAFVAQRFGRPFSKQSVLAGLPLRDQQLTVDTFERAAERVGLRSRLFKRSISSVSGLVLPAIVLLRSGEACVLIKRHGKRSVSVVFPHLSDKSRKIRVAELENESSGTVIFLTRVEGADQARADALEGRREGRHWFWSNVWPFWPSWVQIALAAMLINTLALAFPLFVMNVYDRVIPTLSISTLWALAAGVGVALVFDFLLKQMRAVILDNAGRRVDMRVAGLLYEHALDVKMSERQERSGGIANKIREFEAVRDFFTSSSIIAITDLVFIGVFLSVLWLIVGPITFVPLLAVPLVLVVTLVLQFPLARAVRRAQQQGGRRHEVLVDGLVGIETIKAVGGEGIMQRQWEEAVASTARANSSVKLWSSLATYFTGTVQQLVGILVVVWGVFLVSDGTITVGGLIAASILSGRVLAPLGNIVMTMARAQHAFSAMRELTTFMALKRDKGTGIDSGLTVQSGGVEFRDVVFTYPNATQQALQDVSFTIEAGQRVGLVGRVGSGKSSIGRLMIGFYEPDHGSILIDGVDSRRYEIPDLRAAIGFVSQESELISGTIKQNIVLGSPSASDDDVQRVAEVAGVAAFTATNPLGLNLMVGERGRELSGGQRQAVALARMLLRRPKVLFLDEPSSAMDTTTEARLIDDLANWLTPDQTLIVCSHRMSFLKLVDRLILIDAGKVVAQGPRDDMIAALQSKTSPTGSTRSAEHVNGRT